jgi:Protein of unknown function (DUF2889)
MSPLPEPDFDLGGDVYRRRVVVTAPESGVVVSHLVDDFHDFRVTLRHDGATVVDCEATSQRWPWTTCPDAAGPLRRLAGMPLSDRFTAAGQWTDPKQNCTHQFDAACFAITHAATGRDRRVYDAEVQARDWSGERPSRVRLWVDGVFDLEWRVGWEIVDPQPPFDAAPWKGGFMRWADATLEPDAAERAITLRRACDIGMGRNMDLDAVPVANELPGGMLGICYTMQPGTVAVALRNRGSIRDFAAHPEMLGSE